MGKADQDNFESLNGHIESILFGKGASFVNFVNVKGLPYDQRRNFSTAILIGISLTKDFVIKVTDSPDYVERMIQNKEFSSDEFLQKEHKADYLADHIAIFLNKNGYSAISQSEENNMKTSVYNENTKTSLLPHKTIAMLAGLGWIGNNNLLITENYGCALCMCSVLTDAPLDSTQSNPKSSMCNHCHICKDICPTNALKGLVWNPGRSRDNMLDVNKCMTCLKCLIFCPWTQNYMNRNDDQ